MPKMQEKIASHHDSGTLVLDLNIAEGKEMALKTVTDAHGGQLEPSARKTFDDACAVPGATFVRSSNPEDVARVAKQGVDKDGHFEFGMLTIPISSSKDDLPGHY